jgi:D-amino-acid dehydrogenase
MACGSAKVLSDIISSRVPDIDVRDLAQERYLR